ncbi:DUF4335 domain-containing protein [Sphaerothrix gracilis]|uniref:DUF4335 domain-containing protein n=1 Tax=Sphaerothrix gracilis TaxID=3151835 RepID=UPI0031FD7027
MTLSSQAISRRYVSETWVLEIAGKTSALSTWSDRLTVEKLRFRLIRQSWAPSAQAQIKGSQSQLVALAAAVESYVQSRLTMVAAVTPAAEAETLSPREPPQENISLVSQGLTQHRLQLNPLPGQPIDWILSTLELADLATVLEHFATEIAIVPAVAHPPSRRRRFSYMGIAAASTIAAVGVAALLHQSQPAFQTAQTSGDEAAEIMSEPNLENLESAVPETAQAGDRAPIRPLPADPTVSPTVPSATGAAPVPAPNNAAPPVSPRQAKQPPSSPSATPPSAASDPAGTSPSIAADEAAEAPAASAPAELSRSRPSPEAIAAPPQLGEVQQYLETIWQPPDNLTETLVYDWVLAADGTVSEINPVDEAAAAYRDRLVPQRDYPVFSPLNQESLTIRVTLTPSGEVTTALP